MDVYLYALVQCCFHYTQHYTFIQCKLVSQLDHDYI